MPLLSDFISQTSTTSEATLIDDNRHGRRGNVMFNDGHAETKRSANINPPDDPIKGGPNQFRNALYWDPLQRRGTAE